MRLPGVGGEGRERARAEGAVPLLRREVIVVPAAFRRLTSLLGLGMVFVLMASAMDAMVWTYQMQRRLHQQEIVEALRPRPMRRDVALRRAHAEQDRGFATVGADEGAPRPHGRTCMLPRQRD